MGDKILPKCSPNKNQRLVMKNGSYRVKYSVIHTTLLTKMQQCKGVMIDNIISNSVTG